MTALILPLAAVGRADIARAGGKAAVLGTLLAAGFPVPAGLCVTTDAFHLALRPYQERIAALLRDRDLRHLAQATTAAEAILALLTPMTLPEAVADALHAALPEVADATAVVAVRSSATDEDGRAISFAGQYETVLGVSGEQSIAQAVLTCWRSFFSANALAARAAAGPEGTGALGGEGMAVLVQRMVDAECAGVCFTRDPVRPERDVLVIDAAWGLGAGAVDGSVATDTAWLLRDEPQRIDDRRIVEKEQRLVLDPAGGVRREEVAGDHRRAACLPEPWLQRVAEFGIASEVLLGSPQDVEWAIAANQVWILQSRPITTLAPGRRWSWHFPLGGEHDFDRTTAWRLHGADRDAAPSPLEIDVSDAFSKAQVDALPISCWPGASRQHVINGRRYTCQVRSDLAPGDIRIREKAKGDLVIRLRAEGKTIWEHWAPEIKRAISRLDAFEAIDAEPAKVADHLEDALAVFRRHWMIHWCPWTNDVDAQPLERAFSAMTGLEGRERERALAPLIGGEETIHTRLIDGLYALAQTARSAPALATLVTLRPQGAWQHIEQLAEAAAFREQMAAFLQRYGAHMGVGYGSFSSLKRLTWRQDPLQVLALVAPYMQPEIEPPSAARARARGERDAGVERLCAACDDATKVAEFRRWLPVARQEATLLEEHNYWIDQVAYGQLRTAISTAAGVLATRGDIAADDDIFWLHLPEIVAALRADTAAAHSTLIAGRKAEAEARRDQTPPPLLGLPNARLDPRPPLKDEVTAGTPEGARTLHGIGASAGRRRGRARVVPVTTVAPAVQPGEVLVAVNAGPGWTPIFPVLGGLVLDEGAYGQHAATTAREHRLPAVIGTHNATRRIPDGAWIVLDGEAGTVEIEADGVAGAAT